MTREIPLREGFVALIDDEDARRFSGVRWYLFRPAIACPRLIYACRRDGYQRRLMHREIMDAGKGVIIDHINGNGLDNRKSNLRVCTHAENIRNQRRSALNRSGYKGVTVQGKRYSARIRVEGRQRHLGIFDTAVEAALAYDNAARRHFGEFASPNFADEAAGQKNLPEPRLNLCFCH